MLLTALPINVLGQTDLSGTAGADDASPSIAYDPATPNDLVAVYGGAKITAQYSTDAGVTWTALTLPALKNGGAFDTTVQFDRNHNFFLVYADRAADYSKGAILLQSFSFATATPAAGNQNISIYSWGAGRAAYNVALAVDNNLATFTDPETGKALTDAFAGRIYVAFSTQQGILLSGSKDGGKTFTNPSPASDTATASMPQMVISQGTLGTRTAPAAIVPAGQLNLVWDDYGNNSIKFAKLSTGFNSVNGTGLTGAIGDAKAGTGGAADTPTKSTFTMPVTVSDPNFKLTNVVVNLNLTHPDIGQISVVLTPPTASGLKPINLLLNRIGADGNAVTPAQGVADPSGADMNVTFDANAAQSIGGATAPYTGAYQPEDLANFQAMLNLAGNKLVGAWTLSITDFRADQTTPTQKVNSWSVVFTSMPVSAATVVASKVLPGALSGPFPTTAPVLPEAGIAPFASIASDNTLGSFSPYQGRLYVAYTDLKPKSVADDTDIYLRVSDDGGATWSTNPLLVNNDSYSDGFSGANRPQFDPAATVDQNTGSLVVTYYDARYDAARSRVARMIAVSLDGGTTFGNQTYLNAPNTVIDGATLNPVKLGPILDNESAGNNNRDQQNGFGLRQDVVAVGGLVYPVWLGNQNGMTDSNLDVYLARTTIPGGPRIISSTMGPVGLPGDALNQPGQLSAFEITFDRPVDVGTVTRRAIQLIYRDVNTSGALAGTAIELQSVRPEDPSLFGPAQVLSATKFIVTLLNPQTNVGTYSYTIGPVVADRIRSATAISTPVAPVAYNPQPNQIGLPITSNDPLGTTSTISVSGVGTGLVVSHVSVSLTLTGGDASKRTIYLVAPNGAKLLLSQENGTSGTIDYTATIFDDQAVDDITAGDAPFTGSFVPEEHLSSLDGIVPNGNWQLQVLDSGTKGGKLATWSLTLTTATEFSAAPALPIASGDPAGTTSIITISGIPAGQTIADVNVSLTLSGGDAVSRTIFLVAPDGTRTLLTRHNGTAGTGDYSGTIFDDQSPDAIANSDAPFTGAFQPEGDLTSLNGIDPNGDWMLVVYDDNAAPDSGGQIVNWALDLITRKASGLGNLSDQNANGATGELPYNPPVPTDPTSTGSLGDLYAIPTPTLPTSYKNDMPNPPFDSNTLPLIVPGPHVESSYPVITSVSNAGGAQVNLPIGNQPNNTTTSTITVGNVDQFATIVDLNVTVSLNEQTDSNLVITLTSPSGTIVTLFKNEGGSGQGLLNTIFDDGATQTLADGTAPFTGSFKPEELLNVFNGETLAGTWTLTVTDPTAENTGVLRAWSIQADTTFSSGPVLNAPVNSVDVVFDRDMNPASFVDPQTQQENCVVHLVTPGGTIVPSDTQVFTILPNPMGTDPDPAFPRTYRIFFPAQQVSGSYMLTLASTITDRDGVALDTNMNAGLDVLRGESGNRTPVTVASTAVPMAIGSSKVADTITTSTITVPDSFIIPQPSEDPTSSPISLTLDIAYPNDPDLTAWLIGPDGTTQVLLFSGVGAAGTHADFKLTNFDDKAKDSPVQNGGGPFFGRYSPTEPLSKFIGMQANGTWTLKIECSQAVPGTLKTGLLKNWSIRFEKPLPGTGVGEPVADQASVSFSTFVMDPTNPLSHSVWTSVSGGAGSATAIAVDNSDPSGNTVFVGGASGGIWKTTNFLTTDPKGPTWIPLLDTGPLMGLNIGSIALFPRNDDPNQTIIFAATGDGDANTPGIGILRSMDGGATWVVLDSVNNVDASGNILPLTSTARKHEMAGTTGFKIVVDPHLTPSGDVIVYAALSGQSIFQGGIWRSLDTGKTWVDMTASQSNGLGNTSKATDVVLDENSRYFDAYNTTGNVQRIYAAFRDVGIAASVNRGQTWAPLTGQLGDTHIRDGDYRPQPAITVNNLPNPSSPPLGRIVLAKPELTNVTSTDLNYQGWLYAAVSAASGNNFVGLYMTKDYGDTWTQVRLPNVPGAAPTDHLAQPTNDPNQSDYDPTSGGLLPRGGYSNYALSLAIDPNDPNIVYLGGNTRTGGPGILRIDTTGISDSHAFFQADDRADGGALRGGGTDPVTPKTPLNPGVFLQVTTQGYMNLVNDPAAPFLAGATVQVGDITAFANSGVGAKWTAFDSEDFGQSNIFHFIHRLVTMRDPVTGKTRLLIADEQGVYSSVDAGDGTVLTTFGTLTQPSTDRSGNINLAEFLAAAAEPSTTAANAANALFYGTTAQMGIIGVHSDILQDGDTSIYMIPDPETGFLMPILGSVGGIATDPGGSGSLFYTRAPNDLMVPTDFFWKNYLPRTFGLLQDTGAGNLTGDAQWPNAMLSNTISPLDGSRVPVWGAFAINPLNADQMLISSTNAGGAAARIYGTENGGQRWSVIRTPGGGEDNTYANALAYGAPDPKGPGGADVTNFFIYAGTQGGRILVTFNGGGANGNQWIDLSNGLDGTPVQKIVTDPQRGSHDAYAVTQNGVYFMPDSTSPGATWVRITGNLFNLKKPAFGDPNQMMTGVVTLTSMVADWRYVIPDVAGQQNGPTHPVLYVSAMGGVYRSIDKGKTWTAFPDATTDGAPVSGGFLPNVRVTDLALSIGNIDPTNGRPIGGSAPNVLLATTYGRGMYTIRMAPLIIGNFTQLNPADDSALPGDRITNVTTPQFTGFSQQTAFGSKVKITLLDDTDPNNPIIIGGYDPSDPTTDLPANYTDALGAFAVRVNPGAFATDGTRTIAARATDDSGVVGPIVPGGSITIDSHAPVVSLANFQAIEKKPFSGVVANFTDFSPGCKAMITWDTGKQTIGSVVADPNGGYDVSGNYTYSKAGTYPFTVTVTDPAGNIGTYQGTITVTPQPVNATGKYQISAVEGTAFVNKIVATFTDPNTPNPQDPPTYTADIDWGDGHSTLGTISTTGGLKVLGSYQYDTPGSFTISVVVHRTTAALPAPADSTPVTDTATVSNPAVQPTGAPAFAAVEAADSGAVTVATFTDPGGPEDVSMYSADIKWGDGSTSTGTITYDSGSGAFSVVGNHTYADPGTFTVTTTVHHAQNGVAAPDATASATANVSDPSVLATGGFAFTADEGAQVNVTQLATFTDPGGPDALSSYTATIDWGDGKTSTGSINYDSVQKLFTVGGSHTYTDPGSFNVNVTIQNNNATPVQVSSPAIVADVPVVAKGGLSLLAGVGVESASQNVATFTDPGGAESDLQKYSATIDWGDESTSSGTIKYDSASGTFGVFGSHTYATKLQSPVPLQITISHGTTTPAVVTSVAVVLDPPVTVNVAPVTATEGGFNGVIATFVDNRPGALPGDFTATIDWGDGTTPTAGSIVATTTPGQFNVLGSHDYTDGPATHTITVTITKPNAVTANVGIPVTVQNAPPTASASGPSTGFFGQAIALNVGATDPSPSDMAAGFAYSIDWGDGSAPQAIARTPANGSGVTASHAFATTGTYTVKVTATDPNGASNTTQVTFSAVGAPVLAGAMINGGIPQRSHIDTIAFTLAGGAPIPAVALSDLTLMNNGSRQISLAAAGFSFDPTTSTGTLTLRGIALPDGDYQLQIRTVTGAVLPLEFTKLAGDVDGNNVVNGTDQKLVKKALNAKPGQKNYNPAADVTGDGLINSKDSSLVAKNTAKNSPALKKLAILPGKGLKAPTLDFGQVKIKAKSNMIDLTIVNGGAQGLRIRNISIAGKGVFSSAVKGSIWTVPPAEITIAPGQSRTIRLYASAVKGGALSGKMLFQYAFDNGALGTTYLNATLGVKGRATK